MNDRDFGLDLLNRPTARGREPLALIGAAAKRFAIMATSGSISCVLHFADDGMPKAIEVQELVREKF